jgi:hypothetical protein
MARCVTVDDEVAAEDGQPRVTALQADVGAAVAITHHVGDPDQVVPAQALWPGVIPGESQGDGVLPQDRQRAGHDGSFVFPTGRGRRGPGDGGPGHRSGDCEYAGEQDGSTFHGSPG